MPQTQPQPVLILKDTEHSCLSSMGGRGQCWSLSPSEGPPA